MCMVSRYAKPQAAAQLLVGADAHIGPLGSYEFAVDYRKNGAFCRADVGIGPYRVLGLFRGYYDFSLGKRSVAEVYDEVFDGDRAVDGHGIVHAGDELYADQPPVFVVSGGE